MTLAKKLALQLGAEIQLAKNKAFEAKWKTELKEKKARAAYEKLNRIKTKQLYDDVDLKIKNLNAGEIEYPDFGKARLVDLLEQSDDVHNLQNVVTFLQAQRTYNELIQRYNPSLTMTQEDNVRKTANMVGLSVPHD